VPPHAAHAGKRATAIAAAATVAAPAAALCCAAGAGRWGPGGASPPDLAAPRLTDRRRAAAHAPLPSPIHTRPPRQQELSGTVFAHDKATNCLLLRQPGSHGGVSTLRLLKCSYIKAVTSLAPPASPADLALPFVDMDRCKQREERALKVRRG